MQTLGDWLGEQIGDGKRFKSARQLSIAAGLNPNWVGTAMERNQADPMALKKIANLVGVPTGKLYMLMGWLEKEDLKITDVHGVVLTDEQRVLLDAWSALGEEDRENLQRVMRRLAAIPEAKAG